MTTQSDTQKNSRFKLSPEETEKKREEDFIESVSPCLEEEMKILSANFNGMDEELLQEFVKKSFYSQSVMKASECAINSLFYVSPSDIGSTELNDRIVSYITDMEKIGKLTTKEKDTFSANFGRAENFFVVKSAKDPSKDFLTHELLVGLYGTNSMRQYVPNFSYVYGGFKCSPPIFDPETKKVLSFCDGNTNKINYVIYENIAPSITLGDYITGKKGAQKCSGNDFLNVFLQITFALEKARESIDFTHHNLDVNNVLIRTVEGIDEFQIPYNKFNYKPYIKSNVIATIINYEYSRIKTQEQIGKNNEKIGPQIFGKFGKKNAYPDKNWIVGDLYKLLMSSANQANEQNDEVMEVCKILYSFFLGLGVPKKSEGNLEQVLAGNIRNFDLPFFEISQEDFIYNLMDKIFDGGQFNLESFVSNKPNPDILILSCGTKGACKLEEDIYQEIGYGDKNNLTIPNNILQFITLLRKIINNGNEACVKNLLDNFDYKNKIKEAIEEFSSLTTSAIGEVRQSVEGDVTEIEYTQVKSMYFQLMRIFGVIRKVKILYEAIIKTIKVYSLEEEEEEVSQILFELFEAIDEKLFKLIKIVNKNKQFKIDNGFDWFNGSRKDFDLAIEIGYTTYIQLKKEYFLTT